MYSSVRNILKSVTGLFWPFVQSSFYHQVRFYFSFNPSAMGKFASLLPVSWAVISAVDKKKKCLECQCQKRADLLPSQLFPFPSIVLRVLENDAAKGRT